MEILNDGVVKELEKFFREKNLIIIKQNSVIRGTFQVPRDEEIKNEVLKNIVFAINDGFYSDYACIEYIKNIIQDGMVKDIEINGEYADKYAYSIKSNFNFENGDMVSK